ncbi:hypothetical protein FGB62_129g02 [Gracilaria domingensis]|nr:hypothetical protein FGB62_129g02 [Gracilaria domingensis]
MQKGGRKRWTVVGGPERWEGVNWWKQQAGMRAAQGANVHELAVGLDYGAVADVGDWVAIRMNGSLGGFDEGNSILKNGDLVSLATVWIGDALTQFGNLLGHSHAAPLLDFAVELLRLGDSGFGADREGR